MIPTQLTTKQKVGIGVAVAVTLIVLVLVLYYMITHPVFTAAVTDLSIIILAIVVLVMNIFLVVMIWQIIRLIDFLLFELKPVLESLQETSSTVRGTAGFVSEEVASPMIGAKVKAAGVKGSLRFVVDSLKPSGRQAASGSPGTGSQDAYAPPPSWESTASAAADTGNGSFADNPQSPST